MPLSYITNKTLILYAIIIIMALLFAAHYYITLTLFYFDIVTLLYYYCFTPVITIRADAIRFIYHYYHNIAAYHIAVV